MRSSNGFLVVAYKKLGMELDDIRSRKRCAMLIKVLKRATVVCVSFCSIYHKSRVFLEILRSLFTRQLGVEA